jgi:hypothetical protein
LNTEAESAALLAFVRGEVSELTRKVAFLEGELEDARLARETTEANFQGLSDEVVGVNRRRTDVER